jgi:bile acid:Na+ symporter, BASS family
VHLLRTRHARASLASLPTPSEFDRRLETGGVFFVDRPFRADAIERRGASASFPCGRLESLDTGMNLAIDLLLPSALAIIMFALGLGLGPADFSRIAKHPRAFAAGFVAQVLILPALCFLVVSGLGLSPELAFGMMILSLCPGGPSSNILAKIGGGDVALSISLTAVITLTSVFTIPPMTALAAAHFLNDEAVSFSVLGLSAKLISLTMVPVLMGMALRGLAPGLVARIERPANRIAIVVVALLIVLALALNFTLFVESLPELGLASFMLVVGALSGGWLIGKIAGVTIGQRTTIAIDTSTQNGALGLTIGAMIAGSPEAVSQFSVPSGVYSIFMYLIGVPFIVWRARMIRTA